MTQNVVKEKSWEPVGNEKAGKQGGLSYLFARETNLLFGDNNKCIWQSFRKMF
jgi:hypothetical protein